LYDKGVNVLIVRGMVKLDEPFRVGHLIVRSTMAPLGERSTAGGWAFVLPDPVGVTLPIPAAQARTSRNPASTFDTIPMADND
jgi:hypothetical protein